MALDFPSSPTNGQIYGNYYYDASIGAWNSFSSIGNVIPSTLKNLTVTTDDVGVAPFTVKNSGGTTVASIDNSGTLSANSLTLTNDLTVANGGTGAGTFTSGAYLKGNGTSAIQAQTGVPFADVTMQAIGAAADLNTYTTQGLYHQSANAQAAGGTNYPVAYAGLLEVFTSGTDFVYQKYTVYQAQHAVWTRAKYTTTWTSWQQVPVGTVTVAEGGTGATTLSGYVFGNGTSAMTAQNGYLYVNTIYYTSNGTFSKASYPWLRAIKVRVQGGGGAGGGAPASSSGNASTGGGGGGGAYAESFITDIAGLAASVTITRGAGGTGVSGGNGNAGGTSSFGTLVTANGGSGGLARGASSLTFGTNGGAGSSTGTGDIVFGGSGGGIAYASGGFGTGGPGGSSHLGGGGEGHASASGGGTGVTGTAGTLYGGGGGGASTNGYAVAFAGGAGANGIVIVELYA